jgi:hypothetical protein
MGEWMSGQGRGLKLLVLSCSAWVAGTWACDTGDREVAGPAEHREGVESRLSGAEGEPVPRAPEQVVQRIVPAPNRSASNGVRPAADTASPSPRGRAEPITSKHLEAELNRLEAELGR